MIRFPHPCPPDGQGRHLWSYYAAHICLRNQLNEHEAVDAIASAMAARGPISLSKITATVRKVYTLEPTGNRVIIPYHPRRVIRRKPMASVAGLARRLQVPSWFSEPEEGLAYIPAQVILQALFSQVEFTCLARSVCTATTKRLSRWTSRQIAQSPLMVANPFLANLGINFSGRLSSRCRNLIAERRWRIAEFDHGSGADQAAVINQIAKISRLQPELVVYSGGKSLHAWFPLDYASEDQLTALERILHAMGADPAMRAPEQMTRTPNVIRPDKDELQRLLLLAPRTRKAIGTIRL